MDLPAFHTLLTRLAPADPRYVGGAGHLFCWFCGAWGGSPETSPDATQHSSSCAWVDARRLLGEER
jgi:hypothetical protein